MYTLINSYKNFDDFIKMQIFVIFIVALGWSLILPIITKLQGLLWAASFISLFMIIGQLRSFICPFFKHWPLKKSYALLVINGGVYFLSLPIYFYDVNVFLVVEAIIVAIHGIIVSIFTINYDAFIIKRYDTEIFKDIQYLESIAFSLGNVLGFSIVALIDVITKDLNIVISICMMILCINLIIKTYNYKVFWKDVDLSE